MSKLFKTYKYRAKTKGKDFSIKESSFNEITKSKCLYCGILFDKVVDGEKLNGVDRFYNSKGYTEDNCAPACWICNRAKSDMSIEEFTAWSKRFITKNLYKINESLSVDEYKAIELQDYFDCNCHDFKSYEFECLKDTYSNIRGLELFEESIIQLIVNRAKNYRQDKIYLMNFIHSMNMLSFPKIIQAIKNTVGLPEYLDTNNTGQIKTSYLFAILDNCKINKANAKSLKRTKNRVGNCFIALSNVKANPEKNQTF